MFEIEAASVAKDDSIFTNVKFLMRRTALKDTGYGMIAWDVVPRVVDDTKPVEIEAAQVGNLVGSARATRLPC